MSRVQIQILLSNYFINNKKIATIKFERKKVIDSVITHSWMINFLRNEFK